MAQARVDINQSAINRLVTDPASPVYRQMDRIGAACSAVAKIKANVDTGRLRQAIDHKLIPRAPLLTARVSCPVDYAKFVHNGHGVIRPRRAKALAFKVGGQTVYTQRVGPVAGNPFLVDAVEAVTGKRVRRSS